MTIKDLERIKICHRLKDRTLTQVQAAKLLGVSDRQIRKIWQSFQAFGDQGVISKKLGKPSNHQIPQPIKDQATALLREYYSDFGPTLAQEQLAKRHELRLSKETVRQLMIDANLWHVEPAKPHGVHLRRTRRVSFGELLQADASHHDWFEGRGPKCALIVLIDDATSTIGALYFAPSETAEAYFRAMETYLHTFGRPIALYNDRHAIFKVNKKSPLANERRETQFGRAMRELDIDIIYAHSPQAKGRVERVNRTLQDRLRLEMRLANISDCESANRFVPQFLKEHNQKFALPRANISNVHRPLEAHHNLERILSEHDTRRIQKDLTFQYGGMTYQIMNRTDARRLHQEEIVIWKDASGCLRVEHNGSALEVQAFSEIEAPSSKIIPFDTWKEKKKHKPGPDHPWKNYGHAHY